MKRSVKVLLVTGIVSYCALWGITAICATPTLESQMLRDAEKEWQYWRRREGKDLAEMKRAHPEFRLSRVMANDGGPWIKVKLLRCPAPFFFIAETSKVIGGLNGTGSVGLYLYSPWHIYFLFVHGTWVS